MNCNDTTLGLQFPLEFSELRWHRLSSSCGWCEAEEIFKEVAKAESAWNALNNDAARFDMSELCQNPAGFLPWFLAGMMLSSLVEIILCGKRDFLINPAISFLKW